LFNRWRPLITVEAADISLTPNGRNEEGPAGVRQCSLRPDYQPA
jgi:hypothetical protein